MNCHRFAQAGTIVATQTRWDHKAIWGSFAHDRRRFDARTLANMNVALERVCQRRPHGEDHKVGRLVAQRFIRCAKTGQKTLVALTKVGERA
jgi:hypothetical protein